MPSASAAVRSLREPERAASGSTQSTYHGSTQLRVTSSATLAQPHAVIVRSAIPGPLAAGARRNDPRQAYQQQAAIEMISAAVSTLWRASVSPPAPRASPI